jgi:hypothetical protein
MPKAIAQADTFLKKKLLGSTDLADSEKIFIKMIEMKKKILNF